MAFHHFRGGEMRYQVRVNTPEVFERIVPLLRTNATIHSESRQRLFVAASDISDELRRELEAWGAQISPDRQLSLDPVPQ
jgi:hypothetical protein